MYYIAYTDFNIIVITTNTVFVHHNIHWLRVENLEVEMKIKMEEQITQVPITWQTCPNIASVHFLFKFIELKTKHTLFIAHPN